MPAAALPPARGTAQAAPAPAAAPASGQGPLMTEAELQEAYPPRKCGDGARCDGAILQARLNEVGLHQSYGWKASVVWECPECPWRRVEPLKATEPVPL